MTPEKITMLIISAIVVAGFGLVFVAWIWLHSADDKVTPLLIGALTGGYLQVINYWFNKA